MVVSDAPRGTPMEWPLIDGPFRRLIELKAKEPRLLSESQDMHVSDGISTPLSTRTVPSDMPIVTRELDFVVKRYVPYKTTNLRNKPRNNYIMISK